MWKKIKSVFLCAAVCGIIAALGSACSVTEAVDDIRGEVFEKTRFADDSGYTVVDNVKSVDCEYYESNGTVTFGRDSLDKECQKLCYDSINNSVFKVSEEKDDTELFPIGKVEVNDKSFTADDIDLCVKAFSMDHPEIFWLANRYSYGSMGDKTVIQLYSYVSGEECGKRIAQLNDVVNEIISGIPCDLKQYHLEKYIHQAVVDNCTYSKGVETAEDGWENFTVYGCLVDGGAVCEGYALSMGMLLNKVGIDCYYASGYGENSPHMWNYVNIDGNWYHLDATWDDNENAYFNYFNLTDEQIKSDHIIAPLVSEKEKGADVYNLFLPECSCESANFFVVESTYISDFEESRSVMVNDLVEAAVNKDEIFTVKIDDAYDYNEAIDLMFNKEPYYMFSYISDANEELDSACKINNKNVSIIMLEGFNAVVVHLEYDS